MLLGALFQGLFDRLQGFLNSARNAGLTLEMQAAVDVNLAVQNAQAALEELLDETLDQLDQQTRGAIDQLTTLVDNVVNKAVGSMEEAGHQAQQIVNTLPGANTRPQVRGITPRFIVPGSQSYPVNLEFQGNFPQAADRRFTPYLTVDGNRYELAENPTLSLRFIVPLSVLNQIAPGPHEYSYTTVVLTVPWSGPVFGRANQSAFKLLIGTLPASPGRIRVLHRVEHPTIETKLYRSPRFQQYSDNEDDKDHPYEIPPDDGYEIVKNTSAFCPIPPGCPPNWEFNGLNEGEWHANFVGDWGGTVRYNVTTIHHAIGTSGKIDFRIQFKETRTVPNPAADEWIEESVDLSWGDSAYFEGAAGDWRVIFDAFDGSREEFRGSRSTKFLTVAATATDFRIETADPSTLRWPGA